MKEVTLHPRWLAFIAGTRGALGVGLGLLLSQKLPAARRQRLGWTLVGIGAATTIPAAMKVFGNR